MYIKNIEIFKKDEIYRCFSPKLKKFLCVDKGFHYINIGENNKTGRTFWIFLLTDKFSEALKEWSERKNI